MTIAPSPRSWTGRIRGAALAALPPERLLPETQPVFVSSWVYTFGALTIGAFLVVLGSGGVLALFGPTWWHLSAIGRFVNSLHLWSTEIFFFFMVVHLWGQFFLAAWRGRRAFTWMLGAVCFLASIGTAFTGYLSQQNFDSQWISTQAKDGLNASGVGSFFNVLDFGQMFMWHIVLLPLVLVLLVGGHVLMVRRRGVCPPLPARESAAPENPEYPRAPDPKAEWTGGERHFDLIKELVGAIGATVLLSVLFSILFSSPNASEVTIAQWANANPKDFLATAVSELDGSSGTAGYGPPYTHTPGTGQNVIGTVSLQRLAGVRIPIDTAQDFVLGPLAVGAGSDPALQRAIATYRAAPPGQQSAWSSAYSKALGHVSFSRGSPVLAAGDYGPLALMMRDLLAQARSGGLDGALVSERHFYQTDFTKPLLFLADGSFLGDVAQRQHLLGSQWGMMNESGNYPGQAWLWLYTFWYQIQPFKSSDNADAQIWAIMAILSLLLVLVPFLPVIRSLPRWIPVHRLIWRDYYRRAEAPPPAPRE
ncbi:MAG: cytochrome b N-terminal domain-containing protein [Gaiellaceae bacterium]